MVLIIHIAVALLTAILNTVNADSCPENWLEKNNKCYLVSTSQSTYDDALQHCNEQEGVFPDIKTNQSVIRLQDTLNIINNVQIWTEFRIFRNLSEAFILDKDNSSHVTDCMGCNQLKEVFLTSGDTSSCISIRNLTDSGSEFLLSLCNNTHNYVCEKNADASIGLEYNDIAAIACASFLFISFVVVMLIATIKTPSQTNADKLIQEDGRY